MPLIIKTVNKTGQIYLRKALTGSTFIVQNLPTGDILLLPCRSSAVNPTTHTCHIKYRAVNSKIADFYHSKLTYRESHFRLTTKSSSPRAS